jgi:hypothetical protein
MREVLNTGAGFVGRHFVLLDLGGEVHVVDRIVPLTGGIDPAVGLAIMIGARLSNLQIRS